jgi:hypothetical protein
MDAAMSKMRLATCLRRAYLIQDEYPSEGKEC